MRKLIIATAALAFLSSTAFAQDKATIAARGHGGDTMCKDTMKKTTKTEENRPRRPATTR